VHGRGRTGTAARPTPILCTTPPRPARSGGRSGAQRAPNEGGPVPAPSSALRIALLGCGVVGTQVVRLLTEQAEDLAARVGAPLELVGVAVRDVDAPRDAVVPRALLTADAADLVTRADIV